MVLRHAAWVALIGIVIGLSAAAGLTRFMASVLFGVTASDPATYVISASTILAAALLAGWLPARRAARVDAMTTLRAE
jgi:ABC-type antimicrobial peptide transport system permease subunit